MVAIQSLCFEENNTNKQKKVLQKYTPPQITYKHSQLNKLLEKNVYQIEIHSRITYAWKKHKISNFVMSQYFLEANILQSCELLSL